jgi:hypothetical protein
MNKLHDCVKSAKWRHDGRIEDALVVPEPDLAFSIIDNPTTDIDECLTYAVLRYRRFQGNWTLEGAEETWSESRVREMCERGRWR